MPSSKPPTSKVRGGRRPRWDGRAQELWIGQKLVLKLQRPAVLVGAVLTQFQRARWPRCVGNPFSGCARAKVRLHDARKLLNRYRLRIRFRGTGDGMGVTWEWR